MTSVAAWLESLSPWPEEFGLGRMHVLLERLGNPERRYPAIHVVGSNGKSTTARMIEALLAAEGPRVGTYLSPHVIGWAERIRVGGEPADLEEVVARVREANVEGATQFEVLTAAALLAFAEGGVDAAVVEAGLGGRLDATNVLGAAVVVLTNVSLEHTDVLGSTREEIAREKLAVVPGGATVVLGESEWEGAAREAGAARVLSANGNAGVAAAAAGAFLGHPVDSGAAETVSLPGRMEVVGTDPLEIWDGAHNPAGLAHLLALLPDRDFVVVASILADKDVDEMLRLLAQAGRRLVATQSQNERALAADELARRAAPYFERVEAVPDPVAAILSARASEGREGVLVTGSLYLLASVNDVRSAHVPWDTLATG
jgi:dihydrofolate synthase / folylpolyglutamate synthase